MIASCCWCGGRFFKVGKHYWCRTWKCRDKQAEFSLAFHDAAGVVTPFYVPLPKQIDFELAPVRYLLGGGAAGATKSHMARYGLYRRAFHIPNFEALILRRTWGELEKHHLRLMDREARQLRDLGVNVQYVGGQIREMRWPNGSIIEAGHFDTDDDVEKFLSRERDAIVGDEASTFPPKRLLELATRARSTKPEVEAFARKLWNRPADRYPEIPGGGAVFWLLSNPGGQAAPMMRDMFIDKTPDFDEFPQLKELDSNGKPLYEPNEWGYIAGNLEDNPYLPASYERDLAVLEPHRYQQLRWNNWDVILGQFFVEFDSRVHVKDLGDPSGVKWFRSYDYGFVHYGCCLWWAILPDGRLYIRAELKHRYLDIERICKEMHRITSELGISRISYTVGDKYSMGMRTNDTTGISRGRMFGSYGVPMTSTSHEREVGWTRLRELLRLRSDGLPWLVIHPSCRYLIRSFSAATSAKSNPEDMDLVDDHALSAARYGGMSQHAPKEGRVPELPPHAMGHALQRLQAPEQGGTYAFH